MQDAPFWFHSTIVQAASAVIALVGTVVFFIKQSEAIKIDNHFDNLRTRIYDSLENPNNIAHGIVYDFQGDDNRDILRMNLSEFRTFLNNIVVPKLDIERSKNRPYNVYSIDDIKDDIDESAKNKLYTIMDYANRSYDDKQQYISNTCKDIKELESMIKNKWKHDSRPLFISLFISICISGIYLLVPYYLTVNKFANGIFHTLAFSSFIFGIYNTINIVFKVIKDSD